MKRSRPGERVEKTQRALLTYIPREYWQDLDQVLAAEETSARKWARRILVKEFERRRAVRAARQGGRSATPARARAE